SGLAEVVDLIGPDQSRLFRGDSAIPRRGARMRLRMVEVDEPSRVTFDAIAARAHDRETDRPGNNAAGPAPIETQHGLHASFHTEGDVTPEGEGDAVSSTPPRPGGSRCALRIL